MRPHSSLGGIGVMVDVSAGLTVTPLDGLAPSLPLEPSAGRPWASVARTDSSRPSLNPEMLAEPALDVGDNLGGSTAPTVNPFICSMDGRLCLAHWSDSVLIPVADLELVGSAVQGSGLQGHFADEAPALCINNSNTPLACSGAIGCSSPPLGTPRTSNASGPCSSLPLVVMVGRENPAGQVEAYPPLPCTGILHAWKNE